MNRCLRPRTVLASVGVESSSIAGDRAPTRTPKADGSWIDVLPGEFGIDAFDSVHAPLSRFNDSAAMMLAMLATEHSLGPQHPVAGDVMIFPTERRCSPMDQIGCLPFLQPLFLRDR